MSAGIIIKRLELPHVDQVSKFRLLNAEDQPLQRFIRRDAHKSANAMLTQTYVAKRENDARVCGYVTLMCAEVALEEAYSIQDKVGADRYRFQPAVRIARLGVDQTCQRSGIGRLLVETAIGVVQTFIQPNVGCRFVVLDAKSKSVSFYESLGFRLLDTPRNRSEPTPVMFLDLQNLD